MPWPKTVADTCEYTRDQLLQQLEEWLRSQLGSADGKDRCFRDVFCRLEGRLKEGDLVPGAAEDLCSDLDACLDAAPCKAPPEKPPWPFAPGKNQEYPPKPDLCPDDPRVFCQGIRQWMADYATWIGWELAERRRRDDCAREAICWSEAAFGGGGVCAAVDDCLAKRSHGRPTPRVRIVAGECTSVEEVHALLTEFLQSLLDLIKWHLTGLAEADECLVTHAGRQMPGFEDEILKCLAAAKEPLNEPSWPWD